MATIDLSPLYRSSVGFDRMASLLDAALRSDTSASGYPPYNIERVADNQYAITIAVAGFEDDDLEIEVENGVLRVTGKKAEESEQREFLHRGIPVCDRCGWCLRNNAKRRRCHHRTPQMAQCNIFAFKR